MSDQSSQLLSQELSVLKNIKTSLQRLASIENLLERVATASKATHATQERAEQIIVKAWARVTILKMSKNVKRSTANNN